MEDYIKKQTRDEGNNIKPSHKVNNISLANDDATNARIDKILEELISEYKFDEVQAKNIIESKWNEIPNSYNDIEKFSLFGMSITSMIKENGRYYGLLVIGEGKETDYGNERRYYQAVEEYKREPEEAFSKKLVDKEGFPIDRFGNRLVEGELYSKKIYCITRMSGNYNIVVLTLKGVSLELDIPIGKLVKINCQESNKQTSETLRLFSNQTTQIQKILEPKENIESSLMRFYEKYGVGREELDNPEKFRYRNIEFFIIKASIRVISVWEHQSIEFDIIDDSYDELIEKKYYRATNYGETIQDGIGIIVGKNYTKKNSEEVRFEIYGIHMINKDKNE